MTQEETWAKELHESRLRLIDRVSKAIGLRSPSLRRALYQEWRQELGDVAAREQAKFAESCIAGTNSLHKILMMVGK